MSNLSFNKIFSDVYQLESTDDAQAGAGQILNSQAQSLGERDLFVKAMHHWSIINTATLAGAAYPTVITLTAIDHGAMYVSGGNAATLKLPAIAGVPDDTIFSVCAIRSAGEVLISANGAETIDDFISFGGPNVNTHTVWINQTLIIRKFPGATKWTVLRRIGDVQPGTIILSIDGSLGSGYDGWLPCNGATISSADYPRLYPILGAGVLPTLSNIVAGAQTLRYYIHS